MTLYLHEEEIRRESLERGKAEGMKKGMEKGILEQTIKYYKKDRITIEEALEDTGLTKEEFLKEVEKESSQD